MDDLLAKGVNVVRAAEASLRGLMQTAVQEGQYERVAILARWAEQLSQITVNGAEAVVWAGTATGPTASNGTTRRLAARNEAKGRKSKYPIFKRSGDNLVKIAWSKGSKAEYKHQAPKSVILALVEKMEQAARGDTLITMDNVLPLATEDQPEVPAYQSYACLAWLREVGVIEQHGRQGYSFIAGTETHRLIDQGWQQLPVVSRG